MKTVNLTYRVYDETAESSMNTRPLVVLHGLLGSKENWHTVAQKLSSEQPVIAVDLRNHGDSGHDDVMSYRLMAADVMALLTTLGYPVCHVMGHSMGGKVAMIMALDYPEQIEKLIVVDISPKPYPLVHLGLLKGLLLMPVSTVSSRSWADTFLADYMASPFERAFILKNLVRNPSGGFHWRCNLAAIARQYLKIAGFSSNKQYSRPTIFIRGGESDFITPQDESAMGEYFPAACVYTVEGAGHMPHTEQPEAFISLLRNAIGH